jgi:hypothetical protein
MIPAFLMNKYRIFNIILSLFTGTYSLFFYFAMTTKWQFLICRKFAMTTLWKFVFSNLLQLCCDNFVEIFLQQFVATLRGNFAGNFALMKLGKLPQLFANFHVCPDNFVAKYLICHVKFSKSCCNFFLLSGDPRTQELGWIEDSIFRIFRFRYLVIITNRY